MKRRSAFALVTLLVVTSIPGKVAPQAGDYWKETNGPSGGNVRALSLNPAGHIFAGTQSGGVFRSLNEGNTWTPANNGLTNTDVRSFSRTLSGQLLAGTGRGLFRSTNDGQSWIAASGDIARSNIFALLSVPDFGQVYAGAQGDIFRSSDDGATWISVTKTGLANTDIRALTRNFSLGSLFLVAGTSGGAFRMINNGTTWMPISTGLTNTVVQALAVHDSGGYLLAGTQGGGVFRSSNNGDSWIPVNTGLSNLDVRALTVNGLGHIFAGTAGGAFRSTNNGTVWEPVNTGLSNTDTRALATDVPGRLFAGTAGNVFRSAETTTPGFWNWRFAGAPTTKVTGILIDREDGNLWYVSSIEEGLYITRDGGKTWVRSLTGGGLNAEGNALDPANPARVYAGLGTSLMVSNNKGLAWSLVYTFPEFIRSVLISPRDGSLYVGPQWGASGTPGIYKSTDTGRSWRLYPFGVPASQLICWDLEEDTSTGVLYVCTEIANHPQPYDPPFFRSLDGGRTWAEISGRLPWHAIKIQIDPGNHDVFALTEGAGLYKSTNQGTEWLFIGRSFGLSMLLDQRNPSRAFGGEQVFGRLQGGAFYSTDGASHFGSVGLPGVRVGSIALGNSGSMLYVACYGAGIYVAETP